MLNMFKKFEKHCYFLSLKKCQFFKVVVYVGIRMY